MDIRQIVPGYAVSPQIDPGDMAELAARGFSAVINNRPDEEVGPELSDQVMRAAAETAGLTYFSNPVPNGGLTLDMVEAQGKAVAEAAGPVLAWCRSGTRSSVVWALSQAGKRPTAEIVDALARAGYDFPGLGQQLDALAAR